MSQEHVLLLLDFYSNFPLWLFHEVMCKLCQNASEWRLEAKFKIQIYVRNSLANDAKL